MVNVFSMAYLLGGLFMVCVVGGGSGYPTATALSLR